MPFVEFAAGLAAPELGPPGGSSFGPAFIFGDAQAKFFESPCPGRPHFGVHLADPETGP